MAGWGLADTGPLTDTGPLSGGLADTGPLCGGLADTGPLGPQAQYMGGQSPVRHALSHHWSS